MTFETKIKGRSVQWLDTYLAPEAADPSAPVASSGKAQLDADAYLNDPNTPLPSALQEITGAPMDEGESPLQAISDSLSQLYQARQRGRSPKLKPIAQDFAQLRGQLEQKTVVDLEVPEVHRFSDLVQLIDGSLDDPKKRKPLLEKIGDHYSRQRQELLTVIEQVKAQGRDPNLQTVKVARAYLSRLETALFQVEQEIAHFTHFQRQLT